MSTQNSYRQKDVAKEMYVSVFLICLKRSEDQEGCWHIGGDLTVCERNTSDKKRRQHMKRLGYFLEEFVHYRLIRTI